MSGLWKKGTQSKGLRKGVLMEFHDITLAERIFYIVGDFYIPVINILLPLYYHNYYFDILQAKGKIFILLGILFLIPYVSCMAYMIAMYEYTIIITLTDIMLALLVLDIIMGTILSDYPRVTIDGSAGWGMGMFYMMLCIFLYFTLSREKNSYKIFISTVAITFFLVNSLCILNCFDIDLLGFRKNMDVQEYHTYISTIGNVNWYGAYQALFFPMLSVLLIVSTGFVLKTIFGLLYLTATIGIILSNSDCSILSFAGLVFFLIYCFWRGKSYRKGWGICMILTGSSMIILDIITRKEFLHYNLGNLQKMYCHWQMGIALLLFGTLLQLKIYEKLKRNLFRNIFLICIFASIGAYLFLYRKSYEEYFILDMNWGTNRGYIWSYALEIFDEASPAHKMFGYGCDTFGIYAQRDFENEIIAIWNKYLANAHSELFQLLTTTGIFGTTFYYVGMLSPVIEALKTNKLPCIILATSILTYLLEQLVNNMQTITTPLSFLMLAILSGCLQSNIQIYTSKQSDIVRGN